MLVTETGELFSEYFPQVEYNTSGSFLFSGDDVTGSGQSAVLAPLRCPTGICDVATGESISFSGTLVPGSIFALNAIVTELIIGVSTPTAYSATFTYSTAYNQPSSLAAIAGSWGSADYLLIAIDVTGGVTGQLVLNGPAGSCAISGQVTLIDTNYNAYDITVGFSGCAGNFWSALSGATGKGIFTVGTQAGAGMVTVPALIGGITINLLDGSQRIMALGLGAN